MIRALFAVAICTAILIILFAMPVVPPLDSSYTESMGWLADQLAFADRFIDVPTLLSATGQIVAFEFTLLTMRIALWGVRLLRV